MRFINVSAMFFLLCFDVAIETSFDCSKANTGVELMICSDEELSLLDIEISVLYKKNRDVDHRLIEAQKTSIKQLRNKCTDIIFLKGLYNKRIVEINSAKEN